MLYPFVWQHTLVPVLPHAMTEIASAPTPFILGMLSKNVDDWKAIQPDQVIRHSAHKNRQGRTYNFIIIGFNYNYWFGSALPENVFSTF